MCHSCKTCGTQCPERQTPAWSWKEIKAKNENEYQNFLQLKNQMSGLSQGTFIWSQQPHIFLYFCAHPMIGWAWVKNAITNETYRIWLANTDLVLDD